GTFTLSGSAPVGWTAGILPTSVVAAPGQSGTATLSITAAANANAATYTVSATAQNAASGTGTGNASYVVPCVAAAPTLTASPASQTGTPGTQLAYTVTVRNNNRAGCGNTTFQVSASSPGTGWTTTVVTPSLVVGAQNTATDTVRLKSPTTALA